ncbi:MAG: Crp/Fnr family transcriptional regulator [Dehalococcoidia bacterium]|nr:Crp/Fnr family transcriptional regulator [Dehalococcoidia bacterium]
MEDQEFLARVPLFNSLKPAHVAELAARLRARSYRAGEVIFHQDDPGSSLHVIKSGCVKITTNSPEGQEIIMAILNEGESFGEIALLDGNPRSANAVAIQATQTLTLDRRDFLHIISCHPEMVSSVLAAVAAGWRRTSHLLEDAVFLDLPGRLAKRLLELADKHGVRTDKGIQVDLGLTQQDLGAAVGVSREALNKQLSLLQERGLVSLGKKRVTILRPAELRELIH